ncbi:MAG: hypothetical protein QME52_10905, partial [Bacteroidota bacterium]|nr:hypothetical protein [Bacteroidota bacterium]
EDVKQLTMKDREMRKNFAEAEVQLFTVQQLKDDLKSETEKLREQNLSLLHEIDRKKSKIEFHKRLLEGYEGFSEGTKYLLKHDDWKAKKISTVADILHSDDKYRLAIESALGDLANVIVVERIEDGYAAIKELKKQDKGKTTFISLQNVPKIIRRGKKKLDLPFVWATDVVQCDAIYQPLLNFLFDDVIIAETLEMTDHVFSALSGVRCVTLDGQSISSSGFLRGGSHRHDEGGIISKKSQIAILERELQNLHEEVLKITEQQKETQRKHDAVDLDKELRVVKAIEKEMTAIESRIAQLEFEKKRANDGIDRNKLEIAVFEDEISELQRQYENLGIEFKNIETNKKENETLVDESIKELEVLESGWSEKTKIVNEIEIKVVTLQGEVRNIERDIERADARMNDTQLTIARRKEEIARAKQENAQLVQDVLIFEKQLNALRAEFEIIERDKRDIEQTYIAKRNELHEIELKIKDERRLHDDSVSASHELEMKISEIKSNIEHVKLRALEEFEIELQLKNYPDDEWIDFAHLREEVKNLKERIKILGAINFAAFDEFNSESERLNFLTQQRDDLLDAEKTLLNTIDEINNTAQKKFFETFEKIRKYFITIFKELFHEGDECDLKLEEGVDPLEASIEIIAKPRGKRPTSIDLLSGGEKTLTAIALLFAIYLVKPSPFCILDEVDAPLDDSNIDRYTRILKKFSDNTQFIVVTHNKRTMESAQALYGVTMEEEGVSKIVTVRFNEEARVRSAAVTN